MRSAFIAGPAQGERRRAVIGLRITFVTPRFGASSGGVETHVREVGRRLAVAGHQVVVVAGDETHGLPAAELVDGMQIRRVRAWPNARDWSFAPGIVTEVLRIPSDVVHVQSYHTAVGPLGLGAAIASRRRVVLSFHSGGHSSTLRRRLRGVQLLVLRPLIRRASALVAVSRFERDELAARLRLRRSRFVVIPNGADLPKDDREGDPTRGIAQPGLVLSVGRLERYKHHDDLITALPILRSLVPEARLRIVGRGPDEARLRALVDQRGVSDFVQFVHVPPDDRQAMLRELRAASAVALLSDYESQGIAAYEAIAVGVPVAVRDATAFRELVEDGRAIGVPLDAMPGQLARVIAGVLQARTGFGPSRVTDRGAAAKAGHAVPTWDDTAAALEDLYHEVMTR